MPECRYCGDEFDDQSSLNSHLLDSHGDELGPIDRRRLTDDGDGGSFVDIGTIALFGVILVPLLLVGWLIFPGGSSPGQDVATTPHSLQSAHYHGTITMVVGGETIDLADDPANVNPREYPAFHFDRVGDSQWHVHAQRVTLEYAMSTFGIAVDTEEATYGGTTYTESTGDTVRILVNGEAVDPTSYVLQQGDEVRIVLAQ